MKIYLQSNREIYILLPTEWLFEIDQSKLKSLNYAILL